MSRSTPPDYKDCSVVTDARGEPWTYCAATDTWAIRDRTGLIVHTSSRSWQRLLHDFGPLSRPGEPARRGTRYHVLISDELIDHIDWNLWPEGFHLVEQEPTDPSRYPGMHWWLVEDENANSGLEGKRVELTFTAGFEDGEKKRAVITGWRVTGE